MKTTILRLGAIAAVLSLVSASPTAYAATPTLSVYSSGSGDTVQVSVQGDPNSPAWLYYQRTNSGIQSQYLGTTNQSGFLSTAVSSSPLGIVSGSSAYVTVNGQSSQSMTWPYTSYYGGGTGVVSFSQNSVNISLGQNTNITLTGGLQPYKQYISNPNVFMSIISGNTLTIVPQSVGSGSVQVCSSDGNGCSTISVTVQGGGTGGYNPLSVSQSNVSVNVGSSTNLTIYGSGGYYVSNNSNTSSVSASISGSTLYINGLNYGNSTLAVCQSNGGQCVTVFVTVGFGTSSPNPYGQTSVSFSQTTPTLAVGQSMSVTVYGGSSTYYISHNSNSNALSANLNGSTLSLTGLSASNTVVVVCSSGTNCGALTVIVGSIGNQQPGTGNWTYCAEENQFCSFSGTRLVQYGANGIYSYRTVSNGTPCNNAIFGDPIFGVAKRCSFQ